jgi:hypothetical protein
VLRSPGPYKIVAIEPDSPAKELQVGDLIIGMQSTGDFGIRGRRIEIMLRRGDEYFSVTVEFSGGEAATVEAKSKSSADQSTGDRQAARAYRDKLQQRWEQIDQLYRGGRVKFDEALEAAKNLGAAELAAAGTTDERIAALRATVERLKKIKAVVDAKFEADVEPEHAKLAVDAEVLKAEAELARTSR